MLFRDGCLGPGSHPQFPRKAGLLTHSRYVWADCIHRQQRLATATLPPTNLLSVAIACTLAESLVPKAQRRCRRMDSIAGGWGAKSFVPRWPIH